ncbi:MAG: hypothetical protein IH586_16915 [Anaerolineaceae bacterium]|nr:hypothetical protein [Anaerolineaceae bacterium]
MKRAIIKSPLTDLLICVKSVKHEIRRQNSNPHAAVSPALAQQVIDWKVSDEKAWDTFLYYFSIIKESPIGSLFISIGMGKLRG